MYTFLKKTIKTLIPKDLLFKKEVFFRYFYGLFYIGNNHQCNICNNKLRAFVKLKNEDLLCPFCGSLSRTRRLWFLLNKNDSLKGNILHFSPSRSLYRQLKSNNNINYYSSDFEDEFLAYYKFDITKISQPNNFFDVIICYHILEHIIDDKKAMQELYRVLKHNGKIYIQTPFKKGNVYEDFSLTSKEERLEHFGQEDHVRIYSVDGLKNRLEETGFIVNIQSFCERENYYGLNPYETTLIVSK